ncbi:hypothetical protein V6260_19610, partial [Pseudoalteromonas aliena]|uniref:hypothetical protein n=1 Tax=Pseudoalteromonas aliena TaxID=247523 RepID=UPI00311D347D
YEQPLHLETNKAILEGLNHYDDYYYRYFSVHGTEIVVKGEFALSTKAIKQWKQVFALGPTFNTTLALM